MESWAMYVDQPHFGCLRPDLNVRQPLVKENGIRDNDANGVDGGVASLCRTPNACPGHQVRGESSSHGGLRGRHTGTAVAIGFAIPSHAGALHLPANTSTIRLMLSEQELEGDGEISGVTESRDTAVPFMVGLDEMLGVNWVNVWSPFWIGTHLFNAECHLGMVAGRCMLECVPGVFLHGMLAMYAFGDASLDESPDWLWTTLVLLDLYFVVCTCVYVIVETYGETYLNRLDSRPSIEGDDAAGVCQLAPSLFITCTVMCAATGCGVDLFAFIVWTVMSPMPAVAWMAPASLLAANAWIRTPAGVDQLCACWMCISQRLSTISVAAQFELMANSSMKNYVAFTTRPTTTDVFHEDDRTDTETTISSKVV
eukprot:scaffold13787_cov59-Attheya_sp.AAC.4